MSPVGLAEIQEDGRVNNAPFEILLTQPGPAHTTSKFAPNEYRGGCQSLWPCCLQRIKRKSGKVIVIATKS